MLYLIGTILGSLFGGFAIWRFFNWLMLARSAFRIWRYLREAPPEDEAGDGAGGRRDDEAPLPDHVLSRKEALKVLGLDGEPSHEQVLERYRKLMQKNHPDRGGSDYLAVLINAAKNKLLE